MIDAIKMLLALCMLGACPAEPEPYDGPSIFDAMVETESVWLVSFGRIDDRCLVLMGETIISQTSAEQIASVCPGEEPGVVTGCFLPPQAAGVDPIVYIADNVPGDMQARAAIEEWLHLIAWCQWGDSHEGEPDHVLWTVVQPEIEQRLGI